MMCARIAVAKLAMNTLRYFLPPVLLAVSIATPASAQYACTTSQSISFQTPPGWPAVAVEPCCRTHWGALPGAIDWSNGAPIMICAGSPEYVTSFPNCGDPQNVSQAFPLDYERPTFAIGVAWPNAKDYRYVLRFVITVTYFGDAVPLGHGIHVFSSLSSHILGVGK